MKPGPFRIALPGGEVTAIAYVAEPASRPRAALLLAHGAGAGQRHPYMVGTAERLSARGVTVVTFDFQYTEQGKRVPDRSDVLEACLRAVWSEVRAKTEAGASLFAGGKSMGGRIASQVAAKGEIDPAGLVFLGYPLHPPGKPTQLRDKHLASVRAPMLFVQGTRDPFGAPDEVALVLSRHADLAKRSTVHSVDGGDHSHAVLKKSGVPQAEVLASIADTIVSWMGSRLPG